MGFGDDFYGDGYEDDAYDPDDSYDEDLFGESSELIGEDEGLTDEPPLDGTKLVDDSFGVEDAILFGTIAGMALDEFKDEKRKKMLIQDQEKKK